MVSRRLCGLCLALLLAGLPAVARPLPGESPTPQPSFLIRLWDQVRELLPLLGSSEAPSPSAAENPSGQGDPDLGLEMDPNG